MKRNYLVITLISLLLISCKKNETANNATMAETSQNSTEESLTQEVRTLTNDKGETVTITYFAKGTDVALRLKKGSGAEQELTAKGTSDRGNPLFSDGELSWEMSNDGSGGILTDKNGTSSEYKP